ncbi:MAG TPA: glutathione S-transferase family protein [Dongiaceae bacterium]|nr:glutathione S-transferase family protein [Dongiaceae bacterium]
MYTLYWSPGSASMAPHATLEEIGADYRLARVDLSPDKPRDPAFLKLNPSGKVPALAIDGAGAIYESAAIVMYLADRHPAAGLAPGVDDPSRGLYYQWLAHLTNTLQPAYLRYYYPDRHTANPAHAPEVQARAQEELWTIWDRIDRALADGPYLLGRRFAACDIYLHMLSTWREPVPDLPARCANVVRCAELVAARPAVQRMLRQNDMAA